MGSSSIILWDDTTNKSYKIAGEFIDWSLEEHLFLNRETRHGGLNLSYVNRKFKTDEGETLIVWKSQGDAWLFSILKTKEVEHELLLANQAYDEYVRERQEKALSHAKVFNLSVEVVDSIKNQPYNGWLMKKTMETKIGRTGWKARAERLLCSTCVFNNFEDGEGKRLADAVYQAEKSLQRLEASKNRMVLKLSAPFELVDVNRYYNNCGHYPTFVVRPSRDGEYATLEAAEDERDSRNIRSTKAWYAFMNC